MRAFKSSIQREVAKHFAEFFLEVESNFERVNLDSKTSVLRELLLSQNVGTAEEPHAPVAEAQATYSEPEANVMEPLADDHSGHAHWCRGISGTSGSRCSKESSHESA